jgi:bromodomain-containing protein 7/9
VGDSVRLIVLCFLHATRSQVDVGKMITAAQTFNPDDTLVHRESTKVAQLATRQFLRFRPLVKTPSPIPEREDTSGLRTPGGFEMAGSVGPTPSNRSVSPTGTNFKAFGLERPGVMALQPRQLVPDGMLDYPPNSDIARCVGWYLTGGKSG